MSRLRPVFIPRRTAPPRGGAFPRCEGRLAGGFSPCGPPGSPSPQCGVFPPRLRPAHPAGPPVSEAWIRSLGPRWRGADSSSPRPSPAPAAPLSRSASRRFAAPRAVGRLYRFWCRSHRNWFGQTAGYTAPTGMEASASRDSHALSFIAPWLLRLFRLPPRAGPSVPPPSAPFASHAALTPHPNLLRSSSRGSRPRNPLSLSHRPAPLARTRIRVRPPLPRLARPSRLSRKTPGAAFLRTLPPPLLRLRRPR